MITCKKCKNTIRSVGTTYCPYCGIKIIEKTLTEQFDEIIFRLDKITSLLERKLNDLPIK